MSLVSVLLTLSAEAGAVASAELVQNQTYTYGRFEARIRFAAGDGIISSFFLWKPGSEMPGTFWNELDFEKLGADCRLQTNPLYGSPVVDHHEFETLEADLCGGYHTYAFEWTPTYVAYLVDGVEVRRDGMETATAFAENAASGMQIHFNVWPGDASFGGNFNPASLPVQQYINWVQYSSFAAGAFVFQWREEFDGPTLPSGWSLGSWASPKGLSTHQPANAVFSNGFAVLSLTPDDSTGFTGTPALDLPADSPVGTDPGAQAGGAAGSGAVATLPSGDATQAVAGSGGAPERTGGAGTSSSPTASGAAGASTAGTNPAGPGPAGPSPVASKTPRPASSDGACSHVVGSSAGSGGAPWFALAGALIACWRRRRALQ